MNRQEADSINEWVKFAFEVAEDALGPVPAHNFTWSKRLTVTAGKVRWPRFQGYQQRTYGTPVVHMSQKIFSAAVRDLGIEKACEEVYRTVLHELAHLYAGPEHDHGWKWQQNMVKFGLDPEKERYHSLACGTRLAKQEVRSEYHIGAKVRFMDSGGKWHSVVVVKHNPKNCKVWEASRTAYWNLNWKWLESNPEGVEVK